MSEATNSATTAAVAASAAPTLSPVNICGSACGSVIFMNIRRPPAPVVRAKSITSRSALLNPAILDTTMGKKESRNTSSSFGVSPKPNQMMKRGAIAIFGMICRKTIAG